MTQVQLASGVLHRPQVVFMDCDGVIFNSNPLKAQAFMRVLEDASEEARAQFRAYDQTHGGTSRYALFRHFYTRIQPVEAPERAIETALLRFASLSRAAYAQLQPIPQALTFARAFDGPRRVLVVSGSDQTELRDVFSRHGLTDQFADVLGSPKTKPEHFASTLKALNLSGAQALMIGDGQTDFESAKALGVPFIFLKPHSHWSSAERVLSQEFTLPVRVAPSWEALLSWLG